MSNQDKRLSKSEIRKIIAERLEQRRKTREIMEGHKALALEGKDFYSEVIRSLAEQAMGEDYNPDAIDEGFLGNLWDKAKNMVSFGKAADNEKLRTALAAGGNKAASSLVDEIEEVAPNFPNTKSEDGFFAALTKIKSLYDTIASATKKSPQDEGYMNADAANAVIKPLNDYLADAQSNLSRVYKYMKESEMQELLDSDDADLLEEEEDYLEEILGLGPKEKAARIIKKIAKAKAAGNDARADKMADRLVKFGEKLHSKSDKGGFTNNKEDALRSIQKYVADNQGSGPGQLAPADAVDVGIQKVPQNLSVTKNWGGGGGAAPEPEYDPSDDIRQGYQNQNQAPDEAFPESDPDTGASDFDGDAYPESDVDMGDADLGTSDVDPGELGADDGGMLGGAADALGISPSTLKYLGIAGLSAAAAYATYRYLKKKRADGNSREGLMNNIQQSMKPVQPPAAADQGAADADPQPDPQQQQQDVDPDAATVKAGSAPAQAQAAGGAPAPTAANTDGMQASAPDLDSDPKDRDEEEEEARMRAYDAMQEVKRWQKIAGILKG